MFRGTERLAVSFHFTHTHTQLWQLPYTSICMPSIYHMSYLFPLNCFTYRQRFSLLIGRGTELYLFNDEVKLAFAEGKDDFRKDDFFNCYVKI